MEYVCVCVCVCVVRTLTYLLLKFPKFAFTL